MEIRPPAVAGTFYPADKEHLANQINKYLFDGDNRLSRLNLPSSPLKALIIPHAGYVYSGPIAGTTYRLLQKFYGVSSAPFRILLIGLAHYIPLNGAAVSTCDEWETPLGKVKSKNLLRKIKSPPGILVEFEQAHEPEHSLEVQLPFLQTVLKNFTIYPIAVSDADPEKLADTLADFASQKDVLIVVSSDLSHYLPYAEAQKVDRASIEKILNLNMPSAEKQLDACNKTGILTLMHLAKKLNLQPRLIDYRNSGDTAGDKSGVVGYASIAFFENAAP